MCIRIQRIGEGEIFRVRCVLVLRIARAAFSPFLQHCETPTFSDCAERSKEIRDPALRKTLVCESSLNSALLTFFSHLAATTAMSPSMDRTALSEKPGHMFH